MYIYIYMYCRIRFDSMAIPQDSRAIWLQVSASDVGSVWGGSGVSGVVSSADSHGWVNWMFESSNNLPDNPAL